VFANPSKGFRHRIDDRSGRAPAFLNLGEDSGAFDHSNGQLSAYCWGNPLGRRGNRMVLTLQLFSVLGGISTKLPSEVGERFRQRALRGPGLHSDRWQQLFSSRKPTHVDPGFATDRVQFRRDRSGESRLCGVV
ncbi:MAG: hypothetical protein ACXW37_12360, partial [Nitrospira sp.]